MDEDLDFGEVQRQDSNPQPLGVYSHPGSSFDIRCIELATVGIEPTSPGYGRPGTFILKLHRLGGAIGRD